MDIGCNDGTLLGCYKTGGIRKIGFDPAENLAVFSRKVADKLVVGYFEAEAFQADAELRGRRPKIVTSIAMFYDLENPNKFVSDIKNVMDPEGLWIVQMSYLPLMLKTNEFGNICHEHLEYYSLKSFEYLLNLHGFEIVDVELNDINGGSLRAYITEPVLRSEPVRGRDVPGTGRGARAVPSRAGGAARAGRHRGATGNSPSG